MRIMERPELKAVLPGQHVIELNNAGRLWELTFGHPTYARLSAGSILAITWQVFTAAQIEQIAREGAANGAFDEPGAENV